MLNEQIKPMWLGWKRGGFKSYGIRSKDAISICNDRPRYRGYYYSGGWNTQFQNDPEGRFYYKSIKAVRRLK